MLMYSCAAIRMSMEMHIGALLDIRQDTTSGNALVNLAQVVKGDGITMIIVGDVEAIIASVDFKFDFVGHLQGTVRRQLK